MVTFSAIASLLERALTHASAAGGSTRIASNERLEFLGDRVLGLIIADALVARDREANVGDLSKRLHVLVSGDVCAQVARGLGWAKPCACRARRPVWGHATIRRSWRTLARR